MIDFFSHTPEQFEDPLLAGRYALEGSLGSTHTLRSIAKTGEAPYILLHTKPGSVAPGYHALERWQTVMDDSGAPWSYSDYRSEKGDVRLIDCQTGSVRDDFQMGGLVVLRREALQLLATAAAAAHTRIPLPHGRDRPESQRREAV